MNEELDALVEQLDAAIAQGDALVLKHTEIGALDALALSDNRISRTGKDEFGAPFVDYTDQYKARKTKVGRYRGIVDFTLTGQMLASTTTGFENIEPTERTVANGRAKISFDGRDQLTRDKLSGNSKKRPGFLNPSKQEMEVVTAAANTNMERDIAKIITVR